MTSPASHEVLYSVSVAFLSGIADSDQPLDKS